ncbi:hypothetical protein [Cryobacterium suzukii]|nr:hypothetical protein [Cryobacterium suzukii]
MSAGLEISNPALIFRAGRSDAATVTLALQFPRIAQEVKAVTAR